MNDVPKHIRIHGDETGRVLDLLVHVARAAEGDSTSEAMGAVQGSSLRAAQIVSTLADEVTQTATVSYGLVCGNSDSLRASSSRQRRNSQGPVCK